MLPLIAALATAAVLAASPAPATVKIDNFTFDQPALSVAPGTTVTWVNDDEDPHTIVATDGKSFRSKALDTGERFAFTFTAPGTFDYFCSLHPHMTGKVIVKAP